MLRVPHVWYGLDGLATDESLAASTWTDGRHEPRVWLGGAGMAYSQGGHDGQALAMQIPTPPLAAPTRRKRPVV
jgi:hypothetical protein